MFPACPALLGAERGRVLPGYVYTAMQTWKTPNGLEPKTPVETYKGDNDDWSTSACTLPTIRALWPDSTFQSGGTLKLHLTRAVYLVLQSSRGARRVCS